MYLIPLSSVAQPPRAMKFHWRPIKKSKEGEREEGTIPSTSASNPPRLAGPINSSGDEEGRRKRTGRSVGQSLATSDVAVVGSDRRTRLNSRQFYERYRRKSNLGRGGEDGLIYGRTD